MLFQKLYTCCRLETKRKAAIDLLGYQTVKRKNIMKTMMTVIHSLVL